MAQKIIGLDLGTHEVKAVLLSSGLRSLQVLEVAVEPTPIQHASGGDDSIAAALELGIALLRRRGWNHYPVAVVLPGSAASFRVLKFPFSDARRIAQAIPFEAEGQFPVPLENLEFDHVPLATGATGQALMTAVRRDVLDRVTAAFKLATIDLKLITVDAVAVTQVLDQAIPEAAKTDGEARMPAALLLDIGHLTTDLVAIGAKGPIAARALRRGGVHVTRALAEHYRLDHAGAEKAKRESGFLPHRGLGEMSAAQLESGSLIARAIEPIVREIEHTRMWLRAEYGVEVTQLRLSGGGSRLRGLDAYLSEQLGLPSVRAVPRDNLGVRGFKGTDWTQTAAALGAAVGVARRPLIQLHKDISVQRGGGDGSWLIERMSTIGALGLAILALAAIDTVVKIGVMESERVAREEELGAATSKVFGEAMTKSEDIVDRLSQVEGDDITSMIANRGAVDVLGAFVKATVPQGPKPPPVPVTPPPGEGGEGEGGEAPVDPGAPAPAPVLPPVDPTAGVVWDDELQLASIEIRQKAITFRASATRLSAQDRLKTKLMATVPCITGFPIARARDENNKKVFDPTLEHDCFYKSLEADS